MTNPSKARGTAAETAVVRYLVGNGWPSAERRALHGNTDLGDITGTPGVVWEIKGGEAAKDASDGQLERWLGETEIESRNDNAALGVLVVARRRKNVADWWAVLWADQLAWLLTTREPLTSSAASGYPVRLTLAQVAVLLRENGWGDPIEDEAA